jgi:hypothetical protein
MNSNQGEQTVNVHQAKELETIITTIRAHIVNINKQFEANKDIPIPEHIRQSMIALREDPACISLMQKIMSA